MAPLVTSRRGLNSATRAVPADEADLSQFLQAYGKMPPPFSASSAFSAVLRDRANAAPHRSCSSSRRCRPRCERGGCGDPLPRGPGRPERSGAAPAYGSRRLSGRRGPSGCRGRVLTGRLRAAGWRGSSARRDRAVRTAGRRTSLAGARVRPPRYSVRRGWVAGFALAGVARPGVCACRRLVHRSDPAKYLRARHRPRSVGNTTSIYPTWCCCAACTTGWCTTAAGGCAGTTMGW
jgi:hypothetical protein